MPELTLKPGGIAHADPEPPMTRTQKALMEGRAFTMGDLMAVTRRMGVPPWQAMAAACVALGATQNDPVRPYLRDTENRCWLLDGSGDVA